jgi:hypothetical protein
MPEVDLAFLAGQMDRVISEVGRLRDEMTVHTATIIRLDGTVAGLVQEVRAIHTWMARIDDRVHRLEDAGE